MKTAFVPLLGMWSTPSLSLGNTSLRLPLSCPGGHHMLTQLSHFTLALRLLTDIAMLTCKNSFRTSGLLVRSGLLKTQEHFTTPLSSIPHHSLLLDASPTMIEILFSLIHSPLMLLTRSTSVSLWLNRIFIWTTAHIWQTSTLQHVLY